jgi:hypothetical protein
LDTSNAMSGVTYNMTSNNSLNQSLPWWVFMPYGTWTNYSQNINPATSPLEQQILDQIANIPPGDCVLVITYLGPSDPNSAANFFDDQQAQQQIVIQLKNLINNFPSANKLTIRYLVGNPNSADANTDGFVTSLFNQGLTNPNALLYYGNFSPTFELPSAFAGATAQEGLTNLVGSIWSRLLNALKDIAEDVYDVLSTVGFELLMEWISRYLNSLAVATGNWNHAKIFAANGQTLLQGGANYWSRYATGQVWLFDTSMIIEGGVIGDAHKFADFMWNYLNNVPAGDPRFSQFTPLTGMQPAFNQGAAPLYNGGGTPNGALNCLSVGKNGFGSILDMEFPAQIFDALRDFYVNIVAAVTEANNSSAATVPTVINSVSDDNPAVQAYLTDLGIDPTFWASRYARRSAVANAQNAVFLTQQKLLMDDLMSFDSEFPALVTDINTFLGCKWDGYVRPWDFYAALAMAIVNMNVNNPNDIPGVQIVCSWDSSSNGGYEDFMNVPQFNGQLANLMNGMQILGEVSFSGSASAIVENFMTYKRISLPNDSPNHANHSKVVVIDSEIMYVGSDNVYPSYNAEFGIWIDDNQSIQNYLNNYWNSNPGLWSISNTVAQTENS